MANSTPIYPVPDFASPVECDRSCDEITYLPCGGLIPEIQCVTYTGTLPDSQEVDMGRTCDLVILKSGTTEGTGPWRVMDSTRGNRSYLSLSSDDIENVWLDDTYFNFTGSGFTVQNGNALNEAGEDYYAVAFTKESGFFDISGWVPVGGAAEAFPHNLGVVPELMISKRYEDFGQVWIIYHKALGATQWVSFNNTAPVTDNAWANTTPTAIEFYIDGGNQNGSVQGSNYINYLFATKPGRSKVGSYIGNETPGSLPVINCDFEPKNLLIYNTENTLAEWKLINKCMNPSGNPLTLSLDPSDDTVLQDAGVSVIFHPSSIEITAAGGPACNEDGVLFIYFVWG